MNAQAYYRINLEEAHQHLLAAKVALLVACGNTQDRTAIDRIINIAKVLTYVERDITQLKPE